MRSGHQSFSNSRKVNDLVGNIVHSSILVPYHGWRISHRTHHSNHGHVENDESWHPVTKSIYDKMVSRPSSHRVFQCPSRGCNKEHLWQATNLQLAALPPSRNSQAQNELERHCSPCLPA